MTSAVNSERYAVAEKHLRTMLEHVDDTSTIERFPLRRMLVNTVRLQGRLVDAAAECKPEKSDGPEQRAELLLLRSFLLMRSKGQDAPHEPLNEAAELTGQLQDGSREQARLMAIVFALQV